MASLKRPKIGLFDKNPIEQALRDIGDGVVKSIKNDVLEQSVTSAWDQLLKGATADMDKQVKSDQENKFNKKGEEVEIFSRENLKRIEPAINYAQEVIHATQKATQKEQGEIKARLSEISAELKQLAKSVRELETELKDVNIDMLPQTPGKYHTNFFEWITMTLRNARIRIQESQSWLSVITAKKVKKGYWGLAKKHGTSFTLSSERVVAQQVG